MAGAPRPRRLTYQASSFVPVNQRLILGDVKRDGCSRREQVVQGLPFDLSGWCGGGPRAEGAKVNERAVKALVKAAAVALNNSKKTRKGPDGSGEQM